MPDGNRAPYNRGTVRSHPSVQSASPARFTSQHTLLRTPRAEDSMIGKYAFSFDRETFRGTFNSRQEALKAALEAGAHEADSPATVYVACRAPLDPHAQGHAETLIQRMRRAVRADVGPEGEAFLKLVSDQELA